MMSCLRLDFPSTALMANFSRCGLFALLQMCRILLDLLRNDSYSPIPFPLSRTFIESYPHLAVEIPNLNYTDVVL